MAADRESAPRLAKPGPTGADVAEYLRHHPDFLIEHPDLLRLLTPPAHAHGDGVIDMQRYMLERLRGDLSKLQESQNELIATARINMSIQTRVHAAVLSLLSATTLEHLIEVITTDLAVHLEVDAVILGFEALDRVAPGQQARGLRLFPRGRIERLLAGAREVMLLAHTPGDPELFGAAASLVRSQALLRLQLRRDAPLGVLAFGARDPEKFHPGQGTELLTFLGRVVELSIRGWLDRG
ncbi:MAG TPA: DUF484 family protein [Alphaproteobacteria bacterium]